MEKNLFCSHKREKIDFNFSNVNNNNALSARYISRRRDLSLSSFLPHHVKASSSSSSSGSSGSRVTLREWRGVVVVFKTSSREENGAEGVKGGCKE